MDLRTLEFDLIKEKYGYEWWQHDAMTFHFEKAVAEFFGAPYAVSTDSCTHALELCLRELANKEDVITLPSWNYWSVPMTMEKIGVPYQFKDIKWAGMYKMDPYPIWDCAVHWERDTYKPGQFMCLSFHHKKSIPVGRGGMILLDNKDLHYKWSKMRFDGKDLTKGNHSEDIDTMGYHYYMHARDVCRGILLFDQLKDDPWTAWTWEKYMDLAKFTCFKHVKIVQ
jgi:dTDP-4-amino-4,6-dideoxygalactose transaminase